MTRTLAIVLLVLGGLLLAAVQVVWFVVGGVLLHLASMDGPVSTSPMARPVMLAILLAPTILTALVAAIVIFVRRRRRRGSSAG